MNEQDTRGTGSIAPAVEPPQASARPEMTARPSGVGDLVYALGTIGYDIPTRSRRASLRQRMGDPGPDEPGALLAHLESNPHDATAVQWTLNLEGTPIYVIEPTGPFADASYELLRRFLHEQVEEGVERVSLAGVITGTTLHRSGMELPVVDPVIRGMYSWTTDALVSSVIEATGDNGTGKPGARGEEIRAGVNNFLERVYYELRNLGREPYERAVNYAATNAFEVEQVYERAIGDNMELDSIDVEPSGVCPPGSDCWDVKLTFFFPEQPAQAVRRLYRFTIDVADVVPATVGPTRSWSIR